jgi:predicted AAA+ superfamily ATPase
MLERCFNFNTKKSQSIFLFGPRACGKSYWLAHNLKDVTYIDLLDTRVRMDLEADPSRLSAYLNKAVKTWVIIDEIQKIPELLNIVHQLIEKEGRRFILTGSSARKIRRSGANLLAGRALSYRMYPLTAFELGVNFKIEKSLLYGNLPSLYDKQDLDYDKYLYTYVNTYLKEEVMFEGLTRNLGAFSRFLETASFSQGSTLNMSEVAREAAIKVNTVISYFDLLEDMLIAYRIPVFTKRAKRRLVSHPKFYFFDAGVYQHLRPKSILDSHSEIAGAALETLVLQDLIAINDYKDLKYKIYYWRTVSGSEVDFILLGSKKLLAIEIKHSKRATEKDLKGLKAFRQDYPEADLLLVYLGQENLKINDVQIIPAIDFLLKLPDYLF